MTRRDPVPETREFMREAVRVYGLTRAGLDTDADRERLEALGNEARWAQTRANDRQD